MHTVYFDHIRHSSLFEFLLNLSSFSHPTHKFLSFSSIKIVYNLPVQSMLTIYSSGWDSHSGMVYPSGAIPLKKRDFHATAVIYSQYVLSLE